MSAEFDDRVFLTPENAETIAARLREFFAPSDNIASVELHERMLHDPVLNKNMRVVSPGIVVHRHSDTHYQILLNFNRVAYDLDTLTQTLLEFHHKMLIIHHTTQSGDRLTWIFTSPG